MRDKFNRFMQGRYGVDAFARFTMGVALVAIILSIFFRSGSRMGALLDTVGLLVLLYTYYRMLSRDIQKRYQENEKYLAATAKIRQRFNREKSMMNQRKTHHIYSCPGCGQKIRIPRGKGKIARNATRNLLKEANKTGRRDRGRRHSVWICGNEQTGNQIQRF